LVPANAVGKLFRCSLCEDVSSRRPGTSVVGNHLTRSTPQPDKWICVLVPPSELVLEAAEICRGAAAVGGDFLARKPMA
jgi:hypothetical protein